MARSNVIRLVITGDAKGALAAIGATEGGLAGFAGKLKTLPGFAAVAGVGIAAGIAGGVLGAFKLGEQFDEAFDRIRVGTGATGKTFDGLKATFKNVFAAVPTDMGAASTAVADLNTRLGLTGKPLATLSKQFLELSRITKTDVGANIADLTRLFGDWSISADDQAGALDKVFRASQATGIGINDLAQNVVQFGAPFRQLGFSFDESIALLSKWEKEGVNVSTVLAGMRMGLKTFAKAGEEPAEALQRAITEIKNAGSAAEANSKAFQVFGVRAGPDMAAAIREGRFELGDLLKTITRGKDTIRGAAKDTNSLAENWNVFKNKVLVALEPIATKVFSVIGQGMKDLIPVINDLRRQWPQIVAELQPVLDVVTYVFNNVWARVEAAVDGIIGVVRFFSAVLRGDWSAAWDAVKQILQSAWDSIKAIFKPAVDALLFIIRPVLDGIKTAWNATWGAISATLSAAYENTIKPVVSAIAFVLGAVGSAVNALRDIWSTAWGAIGNLLSTIYDNAIRPVVDAIIGAIERAKDAARVLADIAGLHLGGPTGGTPVPGVAPNRREHGGPVRSGRPYIVGEKRAELFVPSTSGQIIPKIPAGTTIINNYYYNTKVEPRGLVLTQRDVADYVHQALIDKQNRGPGLGFK